MDAKMSVLVLFYCFRMVLADDSNNTADVDTSMKELWIVDKLAAAHKGQWVCHHGTKSRNGCICEDQWTGKDCNTRICLNGGMFNVKLILETKECHCGSRHHGIHCEDVICSPHGTRTTDNKCECFKSYKGEFCEYYCDQDYGQWQPDELSKTFRCVCKQGFGGRECRRCLHVGRSFPYCQYDYPPERANFRSRFALGSLSLSVVVVVMAWMSLMARRRRRQLLALQLAASQQHSTSVASSVHRLFHSSNRQRVLSSISSTAGGDVRQMPPPGDRPSLPGFTDSSLYYTLLGTGLLPPAQPPSFSEATAAASVSALRPPALEGPPPCYEDALKQPVVGRPAYRSSVSTVVVVDPPQSALSTVDAASLITTAQPENDDTDESETATSSHVCSDEDAMSATSELLPSSATRAP